MKSKFANKFFFDKDYKFDLLSHKINNKTTSLLTQQIKQNELKQNQ